MKVYFCLSEAIRLIKIRIKVSEKSDIRTIPLIQEASFLLLRGGTCLSIETVNSASK